MELYSDAATRFNGKRGQQKAYVCITDGNGTPLIDKFIGDRTNIEAEGWALVGAFKYLNEKKAPGIVKTDSQFWVNVLNGKYGLSKPHLHPIRERMKFYLTPDIQYQWIPRDENKAGWILEEKYEKHWPEFMSLKRYIAEKKAKQQKLL